MIKGIVLSLFFFVSILSSHGNEACKGRLINPVTDIDWASIFPITLMGSTLKEGKEKDPVDHGAGVCTCPGTPPTVGVPITFWDPCRLVEITTTPFCMVSLGGTCLSSSDVRHRGGVFQKSGRGIKQAYFHVHWYTFPLLKMFGIFFDDFPCLEQKEWDLGWISEWDPFWQDDTSSAFLYPEMLPFIQPNEVSKYLQYSCTADCFMAGSGFGSTSLFWCSGCLGSVFPLTGSVGAHMSGPQSSLLLVHRVMSRFLRAGLLGAYKDTTMDSFCGRNCFGGHLDKNQYKAQLVYPFPNIQEGAIPLGRSPILWGREANNPVDGSHYVYMLFLKNQCCLDLVKPTITLVKTVEGL